ncbi:protein ANTAGONIST OF LIKE HETEROCHROMATIN PROTEIN 1-like [Aphis craccivora]|uniref:Protein ANTAGONIST OF LIKE HETEROCHROMATIN PROTEIN 1-like n=1 Tax=Aphis craccivora TaxID=307492 RepID=A0A6G0YUN9_APHCR|nr:protein ANTAGONIST OF LIKE HETEROCHROMATIN PROTEIN 1-like [Aphis craccivora]
MYIFLIRIILFSNCWFVMKKLKINYLPMIYELNSKKIKPFKSLFSARKSEGFFKSSISGYLINDDEQFWEFHRLNHDQFNFTYFIFGPRRNNEETDITTTGESFQSLTFAFRISHSYISIIPSVRNFCSYETKINATIFAGSHNSSSLFFNYKNYFSVVLLDMMDANYKFIAIDVGSFGREGDSGIFLKSIPHVILDYQAFILHKHILRPSSRARLVTEDAFGLLSKVFSVFFQLINIKQQRKKMERYFINLIQKKIS